MPNRPVYKAILDTDILSEVIKSKNPIVLQNVNAYLDQHAQLTFTSASVFEVLFGLHAKQATRQIKDFLESMAEHEEITPGSIDYRLAAEICAALQRAGTSIGNSDPLIAACAI